MKIILPDNVKYIIRKLEQAGHEAYAVGGCVRDSILGREPEDWDVTTSAHPEEVKAIFRKTVDTGIQHGTVTVLLRQEEEGEEPVLRGYEVTTYRVDGDYRDGRHPESVSFTPSLREDLARRDFTINAMAYNDREGLVDCFHGMEDLQAGLVRCVGDPEARFSEDALRILRAVRFAAQLGFGIHEDTEAAIRSHVKNLELISRERIQTELSKLLCSPNPGQAEKLFELGMDPYLGEGFSEVHPEYLREAWETGREAEPGFSFGQLPLSRKYLRYGALLCGTRKETAGKLLHSLKLDNDTIKKAELLSAYLLWYIPTDRYALKKVMQQMTPELMEELLWMKLAFSRTSVYGLSCFGEDPKALRELFEDILRREDPVYLSDLIIKGGDLVRAGIKPGPHIGEILNAMLEDVLRTPVHNSILYLLSQYLK